MVAQAEGRGLQFVAHAMAIEGEAKRIGARLQPGKVQLQQPDAFERVEGHGFEQIIASISQ